MKYKNMNDQLRAYINQLEQDCSTIPVDRKALLSELVNYLNDKQIGLKTAKLTFICTHNSRRSHIGQIWAAALASYYGIEQIETYSGGTEATAFNLRAIAAMRRAGFDIPALEGVNPVYKISIGTEMVEYWSKKKDDPANPNQDFAAIMTCNNADINCPIVHGTDFRLALTYEDPKIADDTPFENERYDERVQQIGLEMCWVMKELSGVLPR